LHLVTLADLALGRQHLRAYISANHSKLDLSSPSFKKKLLLALPAEYRKPWQYRRYADERRLRGCAARGDIWSHRQSGSDVVDTKTQQTIGYALAKVEFFVTGSMNFADALAFVPAKMVKDSMGITAEVHLSGNAIKGSCDRAKSDMFSRILPWVM
jgi:hypothetical protein